MHKPTSGSDINECAGDNPATSHCADMIKYKPEGYRDHLNIKEVLDDLYMRINMLEDRVNQHNIP